MYVCMYVHTHTHTHAYINVEKDSIRIDISDAKRLQFTAILGNDEMMGLTALAMFVCGWCGVLYLYSICQHKSAYVSVWGWCGVFVCRWCGVLYLQIIRLCSDH